jgi:hypothetical protein
MTEGFGSGSRRPGVCSYSETSLGHKQREDSSYKEYTLSYTDERESVQQCTVWYGSRVRTEGYTPIEKKHTDVCSYSEASLGHNQREEKNKV